MSTSFVNELMKPSPIAAHFRAEEYAHAKKVREDQEKFLSDPGQVEKILSHMAHGFLPEKEGSKIAVGSPLDKIERAIPEGDPRKGIASQVYRNAADIITKNPTMHPTAALATEMGNRVTALNQDNALFKHIRERESSFFGKGVAKAPGYDEWKEQQVKPEWEMTHPALSFAMGAALPAIGALIGGAAGSLMGPGGTLAGGMSGRALAVAGGRTIIPWLAKKFAQKEGVSLLGKMGTAGALAIPSFAAFDVPANLVRQSDWAQDRPIQSLGAQLLLGGGAAHIADKAALKMYKPVVASMKKMLGIQKTLEGAPTIENLMEFDKAAKDIDATSILASRQEAKATGVAAPVFDTEMREEFLELQRRGVDAITAQEKVLAGRTAKNAVERMKQIEDTKFEEDITFHNELTKRVNENPDINPVTIHDQLKEEMTLTRSVFSPEHVAMEETKGYVSTAKTVKIDPNKKVQEIAQGWKETQALLDKHTKDYMELNPEVASAFSGMANAGKVPVAKTLSNKDLVARVEELRNARTTGMLTSEQQKTFEQPLRDELVRRGLLPTRDMSLFDITGNKVETPEFVGKLEAEVKDAVNAGDPERYADAINHYLKHGNGKLGAEVSARLAPITSSEKFKQMIQNDLDNTTKAVTDLVNGDLGATKKALAKDMKTGMNPAALLAKYGKLGLYAGIPVLAGLSATILTAKEADAGIIKPDAIAAAAIKAITPKASQEQLMKKIAEEGYATGKLSADKMGVESYQKSLSFQGVNGRAPDVSTDVAVRGKFNKFLETVMTPGAIAQFIFKPFSSPQPILASKTQAALNNTILDKEAVSNILKNFPDASKEIAAAFKPIIDKYSVPLHELGEYKHQLDTYNQILSGKYKNVEGGMAANLSKRVKSGKLDEEDLAMVEEFTAKRDAIIEQVKGYESMSQAYIDEITPMYKQIAGQHADARIFMAANNMGMDAADPWLKSLMSQDELLAAARIKGILAKHSERAVESGMDVITSKDFMHYVAHPETDWKAIRGAIDKITPDVETGIDMARYHRRGYDTLPMMPSARYSMERYLPDSNLRIEMASFWKEWRPFMARAKAAGHTAVTNYMESIAKGFSPVDQYSSMNKVFNNIQMFEVARLISLSPSVGFKHSMKVMANIAFGGVSNAMENLPKAVPIWKDLKASELLKQAPANLRADLAKAHIGSQNLYLTISDMLPNSIKKGRIEEGLDWWNKHTNFIVNNVELADRAFSFASAISMASKQGMTPTQASYLVHDTILKANFLSGVHNPSWLRDPKTRLLFLFQGTPYKIFEQRMITLAKGGGAIADATKEAMRQLRGDLDTGARNFKLGLIKDALLAPKDLNGKSYAGQLMRTLLTAGMVIETGKYLGDVNLHQQVMHVPFTSTRQGDQSVALAMNPILSAGYQTYMSKDDETNAVIEFIQKWLPSGPVPASIMKAMRLTKNDIPEIYADSKFKYVFGLPQIEK